MGDDRLRFLGIGELLVFKVNDGVRLAPGFKAADDGKDELFKVASLAAQRKYPLEVHAYTDDAAKQILDVFERVSQTHDLRDLRWCIAHISTGTAETFARMKKLGICYGIQMGPYWEAFQIAATNGLSVANYVPPIKLALAAGLMVIGGTDSTRIGEFNTWRAIEYRVTGRGEGRCKRQMTRAFRVWKRYVSIPRTRRGSVSTRRNGERSSPEKRPILPSWITPI
jgi:predicted amidohydrolase YtcJ